MNHELAAEERRGKVRWLRPEFQAPKEPVAARKAEQIEADLVPAEGKQRKPSLPAALPEQVAAIRGMLARMDGVANPTALARQFSQGRRAERKVEDVLRTLALLGQAEQVEGGYVLAD